MRITNTTETYGLIHQLLHWLMAVLIIALFAMGKYMHGLPISNGAEIADKVWLYSLHKTLGITVFSLALIRVVWAWIQPHPAPLKQGIEAFAAKVVHWLLYGSILMIPLTGWLHHAAAEGFAPIWWPLSQNLPFVPKDVHVAEFFGLAHDLLGRVLVVSLALHIGGALKHVVLDRDQVLSRMVPGMYKEQNVVLEDKAGQKKAVLTASVVFLLVFGGIFALYTSNGAKPHHHGEHNHETSTSAESEEMDAPLSANAWQIDKEKSTVALEVIQLGTAVGGRFNKWQADVVFDPQKPEEATIAVTIPLASLTLGSVTDQALSADFMNAAAHPVARFNTSKVEGSKGDFIAHGTLELNGINKEVALPFHFKEQDGRAFVEAKLALKRLDFAIGKGYLDDSSVNRIVQLKIKIEATR